MPGSSRSEKLQVSLVRVDSERMKTLTITAARKRFGAMLDSAMHEPILITRKNGKGAVVMSAETYGGMTNTSLDQKRVKAPERQ